MKVEKLVGLQSNNLWIELILDILKFFFEGSSNAVSITVIRLLTPQSYEFSKIIYEIDGWLELRNTFILIFKNSFRFTVLSLDISFLLILIYITLHAFNHYMLVLFEVWNFHHIEKCMTFSVGDSSNLRKIWVHF